MGKDPLETTKSAEHGKEQGEQNALSGKVSSHMSGAEGKVSLPASGEKALPKDATSIEAPSLFPTSKNPEQGSPNRNEVQLPKNAKLESTATPASAESSIQQANQPKDQSDKTTDKPADVNATKQAEILRLETLANTPGTALNEYINNYYLGVAQNDHDGIPNQHEASVHGYPETSTDKRQVAGLQNSDEVRPGLYRGANPGGSGDGAPWDQFELIKNLVNLKFDKGVNTVISFEEKNDSAKWDNNVAGKLDAEREVCKQLNINFYNIPLDQSYHGDKLTNQGKAFLDIVNQPGIVAYGHCREGIDRTGYMMAQAEMHPPTSGANVVEAKSVQQAAQDQVDHGYGKHKREDYTNLFLPGADYHHADTHKNWTEVSKEHAPAQAMLDGLQDLRTAPGSNEELPNT
jgi:hypothetical protein